MRQADWDLRHARHDEDFDWAAFASHQAAEKAIKALFQLLHLEAWGHVVTTLLTSLPAETAPPEALVDACKELDKHYIPTRYPNGFERGAPLDFYTRADADRTIAAAEAIVEFCRDQIGRHRTHSRGR
jgi:HEPN domain-containing protein